MDFFKNIEHDNDLNKFNILSFDIEKHLCIDVDNLSTNDLVKILDDYNNYFEEIESLSSKFYSDNSKDINLLTNYSVKFEYDKCIKKVYDNALSIVTELKNAISGTDLFDLFYDCDASIDDYDNYLEKITFLYNDIVKFYQQINSSNQSRYKKIIEDINLNFCKIKKIYFQKPYEKEINTYTKEKDEYLFKIKKDGKAVEEKTNELKKRLTSKANELYSLLENKVSEENYLVKKYELDDDIEIATSFEKNPKFILGKKIDDDNKFVFYPKLGLKEKLYYAKEELYKIDLGIAKNIVIKINNQINEKGLIKNLSYLLSRWMVMFPGLSGQVSAINYKAGSEFAFINSIAKALPKTVCQLAGKKGLIDKENDIRSALDDISSTVNDRSSILILNNNNTFNNIYEYNSVNTDNIQNLMLIMIYDFPDGFSDDRSMRTLVDLMEKTNKLGIFFILVDNVDKKDNMGYVDKYREKLSDTERFNVFECIDETTLVDSDDNMIEIGYAVPGFKFFNKLSSRLNDTSKMLTAPIMLETINPELHSNHTNPKFSEELSIPIGKDGGTVFNLKLDSRDTTTHTIVIGQTGSGKSAFLSTLIVSAAMKYTPDELDIFLIDFKVGAEFTAFSNTLPHIAFLALNGEPTDANDILEYLVALMDRNNKIFVDAGFKDISGYNNYQLSKGGKIIPRTLVVIDEYEVAISNSKFIEKLTSIAKTGRSAGISLVLSSQGIPRSEFSKVLDEMGNKISFTSPSLEDLIPETRGRKDELEVLKGLAFVKSKDQLYKIRVAFSGDDTLRHDLIKKVREKYSNYKIKSNDITNINENIVDNIDDITYLSNPNSVRKSFEYRINLGKYRLTRSDVSYTLNTDNKLLVLFGNMCYVQHIVLSIMREMLYANKELKLQHKNIFVFDLNKKLFLESDDSIINLMSDDSKINDYISFDKGESNMVQKIIELNELYNERISGRDKDLYPIEVIVLNADKLGLKNSPMDSTAGSQELENLLLNGENAGIYFVFHFNGDSYFKNGSGRDSIKDYISGFGDSIITSFKDFSDDITTEEKDENKETIKKCIDLYNGSSFNELSEIKKLMDIGGLMNNFALINDDGRISKIVYNHYTIDEIKNIIYGDN
ncbi:MAG: hypothetical protein K5892_02780 [Acholeplasmatales bacterium]|nr:hypothetical protein [Acholeplasmatales bacterium]